MANTNTAMDKYVDACKKYSTSGCHHEESCRAAFRLYLRTRPKIEGFVIVCTKCDFNTYTPEEEPFYHKYEPVVASGVPTHVAS